MKLFFIILFFFSSIHSLYAAKPMISIVGIEGNNPKTAAQAVIVQKHLLNIIDSTGIFDVVNPVLLQQELSRFNCLEEKCILRFAERAEIAVIIKGKLRDNGKYLTLKLSSYGTDKPFYSKLICSYEVEIPIYKKYSSRQYSYMFEEQAGYFMSRLLSKYITPVTFKAHEGRFKLDSKNIINGEFDLYRRQNEIDSSSIGINKKVGSVKVSNNIVKENKTKIKEGDYIYINYSEKARFLKDFYYGRKREIIFSETSLEDSLYTILFTVPASALMPVASPILGYYPNSDWSGLIFWAVNASPYLFLEYNGLVRENPDKKRDNNENISQSVLTQNRFAWYMFLFGGMSLFIDAFSHQYLLEASNYHGVQSLMGNDFTAGYLALVSGGGGHFYRGERLWGYFYFHLNNILLYFTIREFSPGERYNSSSGSYEKGSVNETLAYSLVAAYSAVKIVEIVHAVLTKDRIVNGKIIEEEYAFEPVVYLDEDFQLNFGLQYRYRF